MKLKNYYYNSSILFKINIIFLLIFVVLVGLNFKTGLKNYSDILIVNKKIDDVHDALSKNSISIFKLIKYDKMLNDINLLDSNKKYLKYYFNYLYNKEKKIIELSFYENELNINISFVNFQNTNLIILKVLLDTEKNSTNNKLTIFGQPYTKYIDNITLKAREELWVIEDQLRDIDHITFKVYWYCVSDTKKHLPNELKYLANENIKSSLVPFSCRW